MAIIFAMLLAGALFLLQREFYVRYWERGVEAGLSFETDMVRAGNRVQLLETVENRKWLPLSSLKVKFQCSRYLEFPGSQNGNVTDKYYRNDLFALMPYRKITRTHVITCPQRGYYGIEGISLVGADLFFSREMVAERESGAFLHVIPKAMPIEKMEPALRRLSGEIAARRYELEDPFTFRGIREYEPTDEMKQVSWMATAKTDELKVRQKEHTTVSSVRIFMNLEDYGILRRRELLEMSISICAGLSAELLGQGIRLSIYANAPDCVTGQLLCLEDLTHPACMDMVLKALARLDTEEGTVKFGVCMGERLYQGNDLYTVFISPDRHEDFMDDVLNYGKRAGSGFLWVCPVKNPAEEKAEGEFLDGRIIFVEEPS
ncbi:MAG: DUF58 domain-containing protein [Lachnospiraceae bacterium]|nr:DUF58 domain-containing protein [Lachnospiraceae bacterium]